MTDTKKNVKINGVSVEVENNVETVIQIGNFRFVVHPSDETKFALVMVDTNDRIDFLVSECQHGFPQLESVHENNALFEMASCNDGTEIHEEK